MTFCCVYGAQDLSESVTAKPKIKLYCLYTPQFQVMYERYFFPSIKDDIEIIAREYRQECSSGTFRSDGWDITMLHKLELLKEAVEDHWNDQVFIYSDVDVIFLKPALEALLTFLGDHDFVVQQGWPQNALCAGFFVMRGNEKTLKLITTAHRLLEEKISVDDQVALRKALKEFKKGEISWRFLPSEQFPNGYRVLKTGAAELYSANSEIVLDDSIILFHANCCIGLENKYDFLMRVQAAGK